MVVAAAAAAAVAVMVFADVVVVVFAVAAAGMHPMSCVQINELCRRRDGILGRLPFVVGVWLVFAFRVWPFVFCVWLFRVELCGVVS